jgi:hypothetical protein
MYHVLVQFVALLASYGPFYMFAFFSSTLSSLGLFVFGARPRSSFDDFVGFFLVYLVYIPMLRHSNFF